MTEKDAGPSALGTSAWSLGGASPEWGPLDLTGGGGNLPPPGDYDGVITDVDIKDKPDALWAIVSFILVDEEAAPAPMWALLATRNGPTYKHRLAGGARVLRRLAEATGTPLERSRTRLICPVFSSANRSALTIAHKTLDGVTELVVRTIRLC